MAASVATNVLVMTGTLLGPPAGADDVVGGPVEGAARDVDDPDGGHAAAQRVDDGEDVAELAGRGDADDRVAAAEGREVVAELAGRRARSPSGRRRRRAAGRASAAASAEWYEVPLPITWMRRVPAARSAAAAARAPGRLSASVARMAVGLGRGSRRERCPRSWVRMRSFRAPASGPR